MPPATPQPYQTLAPSLRGGSALNTDLANSLRNYSDTITAFAGGGATNAVLLALGINKVTTVASAADSLMLPKSIPGALVIVVNTTATATQVFANTTSSLPSAVLDTINGTAGATGVSIAANKTAMFMCTAYGAWFGPVALA